MRLNGIWICDLCGTIETDRINADDCEPHCRECIAGIMTSWSGDQINAKLQALEDLLKAFQMVKDCCDRDWKDETTEQIAAIVSNAMFWRNDKIHSLREINGVLSGALTESNRRQQILRNLVRRIVLECRGYDALHEWLAEAEEVLLRFSVAGGGNSPEVSA